MEIITHNIFMSAIVICAAAGILLQWFMVLSLKGYVKASANMKTTKKKVMINLKNQFEAMYEMNSRVRNMDVYVDKYLIKLRFLGITYSGWEKLPYLAAGAVMVLMIFGAYYGYGNKASNIYYAEIITAGGISLVCLYFFYHIFGVKTRKRQIHIQLVDYLENYLANRLDKKADTKDKWQDIDEEMEEVLSQSRQEILEKDSPEKEMSEDDGDEDNILKDEPANGKTSTMEEDMDMLKRLIREMDANKEADKASVEVAAADEDMSEVELLEEFVQSFLS